MFAGLQKLANQNFFSASAPGSFQQQLRGSILTSPLHHLLSPVLPIATLVAVVISFGEIAVGLGTLLGLFGRVAALGGMVLSLSFFLTVSFNDNPYYYGPDIVFLFAWTPLVFAGSGVWSLDALFAERAARKRVALQSAAIRGGPAARRQAAEFDRRVFLQRVSAAGVAGVAGLVLGGFVAAIGRLAHGSPAQRSARERSAGSNTTPSTSTTAPTQQRIGDVHRRRLPQQAPRRRSTRQSGTRHRSGERRTGWRSRELYRSGTRNPGTCRAANPWLFPRLLSGLPARRLPGAVRSAKRHLRLPMPRLHL